MSPSIPVANLAATRAGGEAADQELALHRAKINCGAVGEVIENLLSPPPPGMMFAHELAGRVHGALVIRVAAILVEDVRRDPNRRATPDRTRRSAAATDIRRSSAARRAAASLPRAPRNSA